MTQQTEQLQWRHNNPGKTRQVAHTRFGAYRIYVSSARVVWFEPDGTRHFVDNTDEAKAAAEAHYREKS